MNTPKKMPSFNSNEQKAQCIILASLGLVFILYTFILFYFRFPFADELHYLRETSLMGRLIREGVWFGPYHVGRHGFLTKVPLALIFSMTGPSLVLASVYQLLLSIIATFLCFQVSKAILKDKTWSLYATLLTVCTYHFFHGFYTLNREIPVLIFSCLLYLHLFKNPIPSWKTGILFLFLLDAKEHVFFQIGLGFFFYLVVKRIQAKEGFLPAFYKFFVEAFKVFSPSFVYMCIQFLYPLVPFNPFLAFISGFASRVSYAGIHFSELTKLTSGSGGFGGSNLEELNQSLFKSVLDFFGSKSEPIIDWISSSYLFKFLMPRMFSFLALPLAIIIPVCVYNYKILKTKWMRENDLFLKLFFISVGFLATYYFRASHGRYLFSFTPIAISLFLLCLKEFKTKALTKVSVVSMILSLNTLIFESSQRNSKLLFTLVFFALLFFLIKKRNSLLAFSGTISVLAFCLMIIGPMSSYQLNRGQINSFLKFGNVEEYQRVISILPSKYVTTNLDSSFHRFYMESPIPCFYMQRDKPLKDWVPVKKYFSDDCEVKEGRNLNAKEFTEVEDELRSNQQEYLLFYTSKKGPAPQEEFLEDLMQANYLELEKTIELKHRTAYLFKILPKE